MSQESKRMTAKTGAIAVFDIDGVIRDVGGSYRRALADTVEQFTGGAFRPTPEEIDRLKAEGQWNNDWEGSQEFVYRYFESQGRDRSKIELDYDELVAFFQSRYRGEDLENPDRWTGYICQEPLLVRREYFEGLTATGIAWGFFSGATRGSASYILEKRLGLAVPTLVAMEDAPGKPDPTGLLDTVAQLEKQHPDCQNQPVLYAGDTVADLYTVEKAAQLHRDRRWIAVGILPPHVQTSTARREAYTRLLEDAGAAVVLENIEQLDGAKIRDLL